MTKKVVFLYSLPSVGPGADPDVQAVSQQVTIGHPPGGRLPLLSARPAVTFPAAEHHRPLTGTKLYWLAIEAHRCEQLAQGCYTAFVSVRIWTHDLLIASPTLYPLRYHATCKIWLVMSKLFTVVRALLDRIAYTQCIDAVYWYRCHTQRCLCVYVRWTHGWSVQNGWTDRDAVWEANSVGPMNHIRWGPDPPREGALFERVICRPIVTYLHMSALLVVRLPPRANVTAHRTRRRNAFAATRGDKTAMRPFAKLLWTLVVNTSRKQSVDNNHIAIFITCNQAVTLWLLK